MSYRRYYTPSRDSGERHERNFDPTLQLERERVANDLKLKSRFEHIFEKYSKDFSNVGDEIDMETGDIVVDNGHITFMQHERDVGSNASAEFLRAFADELEEEDEEGTDADDGQEDLDEGSEDDLAPERDDEQGDEEEDEEEEDELSTGHGSSHGLNLSQLSTPQIPTNGYGNDDPDEHASHSGDDDYARRSQSTVSSERRDHDINTSVLQTSEMPMGMPSISIEQSLGALVPHQDASGRVDPLAIQDLGMSIANQIADFLTRATAGRLNPQPHLSRDPWSVPPLPREAFAPHRALNLGRETPPRGRLPSVMDSPGATSLWAPAPDTSRPRPSKRQKNSHPSTHAQILDRRLLPEGLLATFDREETVSASGTASSTESREVSEAPEFGAPPRQMRYSKDEDALLKRLRDVENMSWQRMTAYFPGRTPVALQSRYLRALKHLPIVKREIIEILDDDDDFIPPVVPHSTTSPRRQPATPLLRHALGGRFDQREEIPTIAPEDNETNDDDEDGDETEDDNEEDNDNYTESMPPTNPAYMAPVPPGYPYPPPGYYYPQPGQQPFVQYPYNAYPPPNGMWYPQMPQHPPPAAEPGNGNGKGKSRNKGKGKGKSKGKGTGPGRGYHNKPELQPRYTQFDTTQGDGRFGILRTEKLTQFMSTPQQHLIGQQSDTTGAFGVLKMTKPKVKKPKKARKKGEKSSNRVADTNLPPNPTFANHHGAALMLMPPPPLPPQGLPPQAPYPPYMGYQGNNQANPHLIRDVSEVPSEMAPSEMISNEIVSYPDMNQSKADDGPYFLSNLPQNDGHDSDDGLFVRSTIEAAPGMMTQESSPPLPTPPSDSSVKFSQPMAAVSAGVAPTAPMVEQRPPTLRHAGRMQSSVYSASHRSHVSPSPASQIRGATSMMVARKRVAGPFEDESEDELA